MQSLRALTFRNRGLAALLLAFALCIKALIPAGYMIGSESRVLTLQICADSQGTHVASEIAIPDKGAQGADRGKIDGVCAFSVLGHAAAPGANPVLLAAALAFIMAVGFAEPVVAVRRQVFHIRPPLRGPPSFA